MAYTALTLINKSYYLSGIVARGMETVSGLQQEDGLALLNALLSFKSVQTSLIPYWKRYEFAAVIGQEEYFIENLLDVELMTFNIQSVRYSMLPASRKRYFGTGRVDNVQSLPFSWRFEREEGGGRIYMYFLPTADYPIKLSGKFGLTNVSLNTDLSTVYDQFYIEYLRYCLANYICDENDIEMPPAKLKRLQMYEKNLLDVSPPDLTMTKMSTLQRHMGLNWADVNLGLGWTVT
jgi:hypothetical protein